MMACATYKETDEEINYIKLGRLLMDGGTQAVRAVFDGIHPPSSLTAILNANKTTLQKLTKPKGKVLNNKQWDKLYPPNGSNPKSEDFDITLLFVLLRNICGLTPPATGWDVLPPITDTSLEANLARVKCYRNEVVHRGNIKINDTDFEQYWQDISSALVSLGLSQEDIDDLKSAPLGSSLDEEIRARLIDVNLKTINIESDTTDIKTKVCQLHTMYKEAHRPNHLIEKLSKEEYAGLIESLCNSFHANTRQWILDQVKSHVDSDQPESCVMLITAGPGMGKSTIAAKICQTYKDLGCLGGCHFFQFSNSTRNNPRLMLQSIARQMCDTVPGYGEALESKLRTNLGKQITDMNCEEFFTVLLEEPCHKVELEDSTRKRIVVVLDAIDECCVNLKHELLQVLKTKMSLLPSWLRVVITSRPYTLTSKINLNIDPGQERNIVDLNNFFASKVAQLYAGTADHRIMVEELVGMSEGLFLVAFFLTDFLKTHPFLSPTELQSLFPHGISSVYEKYFLHLKEVLLPYISEEERFYKMLEAIVAVVHPIPCSMFYTILGLKSERQVPRQGRKSRKDALNSLHSLFPVENDHVTVFHKSVVDWLILEGDEEHDFSVRVDDGNEVLANQCYDVLNDIRNGKKDLDEPLVLTDDEIFSLTFGLNHMRPFFRRDKKFSNLRNYFVLSAMMNGLEYGQSTLYIRMMPDLSYEMNVIFSIGIKYFSCDISSSILRPLKFGQCVEFFLNAANMMQVSQEGELMTPTPIELLKQHKLSYYEVKGVIVDLEKEVDKPNVTVISCDNGFFLIQEVGQNTTVNKYLLDGTCLAKESFPAVKINKICISPDQRYIVATNVRQQGDIGIMDARTLGLVTSYHPPDVVSSCHVYGDQPWYIVVRCSDSKIYVIDGETGETVSVIEVNQNVSVDAVSCEGHVVLGRPWYYEGDGTDRDDGVYSKAPNAATNDAQDANDGVDDANDDIHAFFDKDADGCPVVYTANGMSATHELTHRKLLLLPLKTVVSAIPNHLSIQNDPSPRISRTNSWPLNDLPFPSLISALRFSRDGTLLAYLVGDTVIVINTSDGSLNKNICLGPGFGMHKRTCILFFSATRLVVHDYSVVMFIDVQTNEIQHRFALPGSFTTLCAIANEQGPFTLLTDFCAETKCVEQYQFYDLDF